MGWDWLRPVLPVKFELEVLEICDCWIFSGIRFGGRAVCENTKVVTGIATWISPGTSWAVEDTVWKWCCVKPGKWWLLPLFCLENGFESLNLKKKLIFYKQKITNFIQNILKQKSLKILYLFLIISKIFIVVKVLR